MRELTQRHHAKDYLFYSFWAHHTQARQAAGSYRNCTLLARIIFDLLSTRESYSKAVLHHCEEETLRWAKLRLRMQAAQLGFQIVLAVNR